jgi:hypothetical protein
MFAAFLHALPGVLAGLFGLFMLYGFWQGLGLRPHRPGHRAPVSLHWWWGPRD